MEVINFIFSTPTGVAILVFGGMLVFVIIAIVAEHKTHKMFYNHEPEKDDLDFWEDEDDDWDDEDDDEE